MALEDIIKRIKDDARAEVARIEEDARHQRQEILEKARQEAEGFEQKLMEEVRKKAAQQRERVISMARLELRKTLLQKKQEGIEEAFSRATKKLMNLKREDYLALLKRLLLRATESGDEEIIVSESHRSMVSDDFLSQVNKEIGGGKLRLSKESREMGGGFILRKGRREINYSLEMILKDLKDELEPEVARILFGKS